MGTFTNFRKASTRPHLESTAFCRDLVHRSMLDSFEKITCNRGIERGQSREFGKLRKVKRTVGASSNNPPNCHVIQFPSTTNKKGISVSVLTSL